MALSVQKVREQDSVIDFKATLVSSDYAKELNSWLDKKAKNVRIDGFRPGKAPLTVIQNRYRDEAHRSVVNTLIDQVLHTIDKEHKIRVAGQPKVTVEKADAAEGFECSVSVECLPTVKLKDFSTISCEELVIEISKQEVDEAVTALLKRYKSHAKDAKKGKATWGDKVTFLIKEKGSADKAEQQDLVLSEDLEDPTWMPLHKAALGKSAGDKTEATIVFPKNFSQAVLAGKTFIYELEIMLVYGALTFKLDNDFAKEFECTDLNGLHKKMEETLRNDKKHLVGLYHKRQILDQLHEQYPLAMPKSSIDHEFQQIWGQLQEEVAAARKRGEKEDIDLKQVEVEYREIAGRRVKLGLLISEIAKEHKIALTKEEIQREIMMEAMKYQGQFKEVVDYYVNNPRILERLIAPALEDKVVEFVLSKAKKKQTKITTKELPAKLKGIVPGYDADDDESVKASAKKPAKQSKTKEKGE